MLKQENTLKHNVAEKHCFAVVLIKLVSII